MTVEGLGNLRGRRRLPGLELKALNLEGKSAIPEADRRRVNAFCDQPMASGVVLKVEGNRDVRGLRRMRREWTFGADVRGQAEVGRGVGDRFQQVALPSTVFAYQADELCIRVKLDLKISEVAPTTYFDATDLHSAMLSRSSGGDVA